MRLWLLPATQLIGSTGAVSSLAFNPHGGTLASGGVDGMIQVWDVADPAHPVQLGQPLAGGIGDINTVAFSPDGRTLAAGGSHGTIRLWDMAHPAHPQPLIPPLPGPSGMATVSAVVFSPNGQTLAGCGYDKFFNGIVQLWNVHVPARPVALGQPLTASMNSEAMLSLAFSRDGSMLAAAPGLRESICGTSPIQPPPSSGVRLSTAAPTTSIRWRSVKMAAS